MAGILQLSNKKEVILPKNNSFVLPVQQEYFAWLESCKNDLGLFFTDIVWPACVKDELFIKSPYGFDLMVEYATAWSIGQIPNLIILVAPRNGKSKLLSIALPTWIWLNKPSSRILSISNSDEVCQDFRIERTKILASAHFNKLFDSRIVLNNEDRTENSDGGYFMSWPILNSRTGLGAHYIIVDDPIQNKHRNNRAHNIKVYEEYSNGLLQRRNSKNINSPSPAMITMQSLSDFDLAHVMKDKGYEVLELQSFAEEPQQFIFPMSGKVWNRPYLDVLNPELESLETLYSLRLSVENFAAQYQQRPRVAQKNAMIQEQSLHTYKKKEKYTKIYLSLDSAATVNEQSANWAFGIIGEFVEDGETKFHLLYVHALKYEYPQGKAKLIELLIEWNVNCLLIEFKSTGISLYQEMSFMFKLLEIVKLTPTVNKESRQLQGLPGITSGKMMFPDLKVFPHCVWMSLVIYELTGFPTAKTDDILDMLTQFINQYATGSISLKQFYAALNKKSYD
jgi:hypothetical protein